MKIIGTLDALRYTYILGSLLGLRLFADASVWAKSGEAGWFLAAPVAGGCVAIWFAYRAYTSREYFKEKYRD